jgi:BMFP domain-containing protein YqiC
MEEQLRIDEIARRLFAKVPEAARNIQADLEDNFRAVLRASLGRLDLVSRDEFDVQTKVLERTRARLEALEARVQELQSAKAQPDA